MATLKNGELTGSLKDKVIYKIQDKTIVRGKGGASREKIRKDPSFARTRELNKEFAGCSKAGTAVRRAIYPVRHMADYNISGPLNAIAKKVQGLDTDHPHGRRAVYFSKLPRVLDGFSLNHKNILESIVRTPITITCNREERKAIVRLPSLEPGINFADRNKRPLYRFVIVLGIISDMEYDEKYNEYRPLNPATDAQCATVTTEWRSALQSSDSQTLELAISDSFVLDKTDTFVLAAGIEFGNPVTNMVVEPIKYSGSAKILATF